MKKIKSRGSSDWMFALEFCEGERSDRCEEGGGADGKGE
jgi:hypothetical protein